MMSKSRQNTRSSRGVFRGFTLIEALVFLAVFSIITMAFYQTWTLGMQHIINAKNRLGATAVANEKMEIIRSLIFDNIGTTTGIPNGTLSEDEAITANTTTYQVHTVVQFVDDPTDGTAAAHSDVAPNDYKKVTLTVSWGGGSESERVEMVSVFSLDGVESVAAGTGILSINVLNAAGLGVSDATVHIVNPTVSPTVNITATTDAGGNLTFPGAPASVQNYQISVSKSGYYSNQTYPPYPTSSYKPVNVHATVVAGSLTSATLVSDQLSTIEFHTRSPSGDAIPDIPFSISGGLVIGNDATTGVHIYDYSQSATTNSDGDRDIEDRSTGAYTVTLGSSVTGYEFLRLEPELADRNGINLSPGTSQSVAMRLADKSVASALITATRSSDGTGIAGATVRLSNSSLGYDVTVTADSYGQAYFPVDSTPLIAGTYDIEVSASGFENESGSVTVGSGLIKESVALSAS